MEHDTAKLNDEEKWEIIKLFLLAFFFIILPTICFTVLVNIWIGLIAFFIGFYFVSRGYVRGWW